MRNREKEWSNPLARFLGVFFLPSILSLSYGYIKWLILGPSNNNWDSEASAVLLVYFIAISIPLFLTLEWLYEKFDTVRHKRWIFGIIGSLLGTFPLMILVATTLIKGAISESPDALPHEDSANNPLGLDHYFLPSIVVFLASIIIFPSLKSKNITTYSDQST